MEVRGLDSAEVALFETFMLAMLRAGFSLSFANLSLSLGWQKSASVRQNARNSFILEEILVNYVFSRFQLAVPHLQRCPVWD